MKKIEWENDDKMVFESGHKTFDRQIQLICKGNVISPCQLSTHVRAYAELSCNGMMFEPGHLRDHDLGWFDNTGMSKSLRQWLLRITQEEGAWVYRFCHYNSQGRRVVHGWVVTTNDHRLLVKYYTGPTYKSEWVIDEAAKYVSNEAGGNDG